MKKFLTAVVAVLALALGVFLTTPAQAATPTIQITKAKSAQERAQAWESLEYANYKGRVNLDALGAKYDRVLYVGTSSKPVTKRPFVSVKSLYNGKYNVFTFTKGNRMEKSTFAALAKSMPKCKTEDSALCYWDAKANGNRVGKSFVNISKTLTLYSK